MEALAGAVGPFGRGVAGTSVLLARARTTQDHWFLDIIECHAIFFAFAANVSTTAPTSDRVSWAGCEAIGARRNQHDRGDRGLCSMVGLICVVHRDIDDIVRQHVGST